MLKIYTQAFMKAFDFTGRATRKEFWVFTITAYILVILLGIFTAMCTSIENISETAVFFVNTLSILLSIILIFPSIALAVRRLHDVGLSGFCIFSVKPHFCPAFGIYRSNLRQICNLHFWGLDFFYQ